MAAKEQSATVYDVKRLINLWIFKLQLVVTNKKHKDLLTVLAQCEYPIKEVFQSIRENNTIPINVETPTDRLGFILVSEMQKCSDQVSTKVGLDLSELPGFFETKVPQSKSFKRISYFSQDNY